MSLRAVSSAPMPRFRTDLDVISRYKPGRPIAEVAREHGLDPASFIKLASNESPYGPFPAAVEAMREAASGTNRYPDNEGHDLRVALAKDLDVDYSNVWLGGGSSELIRSVAIAAGGPGTTAVYAWPSFVIYRLGTLWAMAEPRQIPLNDGFQHDLGSMADAIDDTTTVVYICNPNNPTGTAVSPDEIERFVAEAPPDVTVVIDEAYYEFVTTPGHRTMIPLALERENVVVTRTFSKIYALAALRVGYAVANADTIADLRRVQAPFSVTQPGQAAAMASLADQTLKEERAAENADERTRILNALTTRGVEHTQSEANFIWLRCAEVDDPQDAFVSHGVIVRHFGTEWIRVTVGTPEENDRFLNALDVVRG
ncbi:MAG: histidinol-phosphate transaminase [Acidimicrobiia bacterium]|nr:histidinol-phosphate transaminase [Acidimicrobiia bacterium]